jgi:hypothetical protein
MALKIIDDAEWVLKNAWSVRFNIAGAVCGAVVATIGVISAYAVVMPIGPITLAITCGIATLGASAAAIAARFTKQDRPSADASE